MENPMIADSTKGKGYFEPAYGLDDEELLEAYPACLAEYKRYFDEIRTRLDPKLTKFIEGYVLGNIHRKGLHDEYLVSIALAAGQSDSDAEVSLQLSRKFMGLEPIALRYRGVSTLDFPKRFFSSPIAFHEIFQHEGTLQHFIYFIGASPIRLDFRDFCVLNT